MRPRCMHWNGAIFAVGYDPATFDIVDNDGKKIGTGTGPWRKTFPNVSRLAQVVGGGGVQVDVHNNAFEVTNPQFEAVYLNRGAA